MASIVANLPITNGRLSFAVSQSNDQWQLVIGNYHIKPCASRCSRPNLLHKRELMPKGSVGVRRMCSDVGRSGPTVGLPAGSSNLLAPDVRVGDSLTDNHQDARGLG